MTSIDREGKRTGFDIDLYQICDELVTIPIIANGGACNLNSFVELFDKTRLSSASAGSCFVYYGKRKAVLINYPNKDDLNLLFEKIRKIKINDKKTFTIFHDIYLYFFNFYFL